MPHPLLQAAEKGAESASSGDAAGGWAAGELFTMRGHDLTQALSVAGVLLGVAAGAVVIHWIVFAIAQRAVRRKALAGDAIVVKKLRGPMRLVMAVLAVQFFMPGTPMPDAVRVPLRHALSLTLILSVTWAVIQLILSGAAVIAARYNVSVADNLAARRAHTQIRTLSRVLSVVAGIVGVGVALTTFPAIRQVGASILASAGIASLIVGLAAQKVIANFLAGLQIAFTGPINLDDVVVIENEWGRIEEITMTYVVVRIWDDRRLIVPFSQIIDEPFTNWTRTQSQILGTVYLHADYTVPIEPLRQELRRIVEASAHWDKRVCGLVVTDATPETVQLRALVSARDGSNAWDLRCEVREGLIGFLQREHPECLPRRRVLLDGPPEPEE